MAAATLLECLSWIVNHIFLKVQLALKLSLFRLLYNQTEANRLPPWQHLCLCMQLESVFWKNAIGLQRLCFNLIGFQRLQGRVSGPDGVPGASVPVHVEPEPDLEVAPALRGMDPVSEAQQRRSHATKKNVPLPLVCLVSPSCCDAEHVCV